MNQGGSKEEMKGPVIWAIDARKRVLQRVEEVLLHEIEDCQYHSFIDARRAVLHSRREVPNLVILGLASNTIGPDELLAIRDEFDAIKDVPVIVLFGEDDSVSVETAIASGAADAVVMSQIEEELGTRVKWQFLRREPEINTTNGSNGTNGAIEGLSALHTFDFLTRVIDASPNAIVAARREGEIVLFNPAAEEILGWAEEDALGMNVRRLYPLGGAERIMRMIRAEDHGGRGLIDSLREVVVNTRQELIPVEISAALVYEDGREIATVGIFTDLRRQVRMEERLQESIEELELTQRQAVVAEVAGAAAHKLNQPLTSLLGYTELLRRQLDEDDELFRVATTIHNDASSIAEVVRKIGRITRYRTQEYAGGEQIMNLEEASQVEDIRPQKNSNENERLDSDSVGEGE